MWKHTASRLINKTCRNIWNFALKYLIASLHFFFVPVIVAKTILIRRANTLWYLCKSTSASRIGAPKEGTLRVHALYVRLSWIRKPHWHFTYRSQGENASGNRHTPCNSTWQPFRRNCFSRRNRRWRRSPRVLRCSSTLTRTRLFYLFERRVFSNCQTRAWPRTWASELRCPGSRSPCHPFSSSGPCSSNRWARSLWLCWARGWPKCRRARICRSTVSPGACTRWSPDFRIPSTYWSCCLASVSVVDRFYHRKCSREPISFVRDAPGRTGKSAGNRVWQSLSGETTEIRLWFPKNGGSCLRTTRAIFEFRFCERPVARRSTEFPGRAAGPHLPAVLVTNWILFYY